MHLLFDAKTKIFWGEVQEKNGKIVVIVPNAQGKKRLTTLLSEWQVQGIEVLRSVTRTEGKTVTTQFVHERVLFSDVHAFEALQISASRYGLELCSLPDAAAPYWNELVTWPMSHGMKQDLAFFIQQFFPEMKAAWPKRWEELRLEMKGV
ncbi:hypothetical protein KBD61_03640 [Patescibacteria group bacterium]|nr:hypothetical protein [Patescibacteria group bacterium]MBP9710090.1 hypothetical protein [Patescibacteria group bacterium]